ncbi:MAG: hypothetical protein Pg6C_00140 [Treponemataceae bacterium]|nr:MAG: hypothetical protein Pg6C_00140 [Treponemataceae bacterium]
MRKKKNIKSVLILSFVSLACLCASAYCIYLFYKDVNATLTKQNENPIARVISKRKTVQRKFSDRALWDRLQHDSPVYNRDTVRTAEASYAVIGFPAGTRLELTSNSLVTIFLEGDKPAADLAGGRVNIDTTRSREGFIFRSGEKIVEIAAGGVSQAAVSSEGGVELRVIEGNAVIPSESEDILLREETGYEIFQTGAGTRAAESPMVVMRNPPPSARIVSQEPFERVVFNLAPIQKPSGSNVILDIASDSDFNNIALTDKIPEDSVTEELAPGIYYWRAYFDSGAQDRMPSSGRMEIVHVPQPVCVMPAQEQIFNYKTQKPPINFSWTKIDAADSYTIVIADNSRLDSPAVNTQVSRPSYTTDTLDAGKWYWQITPVLNGTYSGKILSSKISSFSIARSNDLHPPELISPAENAKIDTNKTNGEIFFSWKNVREALKYTIEILQDGKLTESAEVEHNLFRLARREGETIAHGNYEWRVTAIDNEGKSPVSSRSFSVAAVEPVHRALFPPARYAVEQPMFPALVFLWETNLAEKARFQISRDSSFSSLAVDALTTENSATGLSLEPGEYFWRVLAGSVITGGYEFSILPPMDSSFAISPVNGARVTAEGNYAFRWTQPDGATRFNMSMYRLNTRGEKTGFPVFSRESLDAASVTVNMARLDSGDYLWTIEPFAPETALGPARAGKIAEFRFTYAKPEPSPAVPKSQPPPAPPLQPAQSASAPRRALPQPVVIAPLRNQVFSSDYFAAQHYIQFLWNPVEGAETYTVKILKYGAVIYEAANLTNSAFTLTNLAILDRGSFSYQIEAADGTLTSAASGTFLVSIPPMSVPHMTSPGVLFAY